MSRRSCCFSIVDLDMSSSLGSGRIGTQVLRIFTCVCWVADIPARAHVRVCVRVCVCVCACVFVCVCGRRACAGGLLLLGWGGGLLPTILGPKPGAADPVSLGSLNVASCVWFLCCVSSFPAQLCVLAVVFVWCSCVMLAPSGCFKLAVVKSARHVGHLCRWPRGSR